MVAVGIVVCEVLFWVAMLAGLTARYLAQRRRLGAALLIVAPIVDVALLVLVAADLRAGATASWQHGLAAIYIGISVGYGKRMVAWADLRFAHRFAGGPAPERLTGARYAGKCWRDVLATGVAAVIAAALLGAIILLVDDAQRTAALTGYFGLLATIFAIDLLWALSYTIWPKKP
ncbi:MAG: hypothetical protein QM679_11680 [Patulibacter sp.]